MDEQLKQLEDIAFNTGMLPDVESRLGYIEAEVRTTNDLLRDILSELQQR